MGRGDSLSGRIFFDRRDRRQVDGLNDSERGHGKAWTTGGCGYVAVKAGSFLVEILGESNRVMLRKECDGRG